MRKAIQARDWKDTLAVVQYLQGLNPFSNDPSMRNIATAVNAHPIINVDTARSVGAAILKSMEGKTSDEHSFIRKDQVVTLGTKSFIKIDGSGSPGWSITPLPKTHHCCTDIRWTGVRVQSWTMQLPTSSVRFLSPAPRCTWASPCWCHLGLLEPDVQADVPNKDSRYVLGGGGYSFNESHGLADRQPVNWVCNA